MKSRLKKLHLLDSYEIPNWQNQTLYTWKDKFIAKQTHYIKHEYTPAMGAYWAEAKSKPKTFEEIVINDSDLSWDKFCLTQEFKDRVLQSFLSGDNSSNSRRVWRVEYILKTGANWHGPIKNFHLEIIPPLTTS